jgi:hypothetical protein
MTGTSLADLREMLKGEIDTDLDSSISPGGDDVLNVKLSNCQKWLALNHDFADLNIRPEVNLVAGTRYYNFPTFDSQALETNRKMTFECYWSNLWYSVEAGIKLVNYNTLNPELNQRLDPVIRWQKYRLNKTTVQFEVWPLPATATRIRITGQKRLSDLAADGDTCDLDDLLIVQFTAAKVLAGLKSADAQAMLVEAQTTLRRLQGGDNGPSQVFSMGGSPSRRRDSERPTVAVNYTP